MRTSTAIPTVTTRPYASLAVLLHRTLAILIMGVVALGW